MAILPYQILSSFAILHHRFCMCTIGLGLELKKGNWPCRQSQDKKCTRPSGHLEPHMYHIIEPTFTCVRRYVLRAYGQQQSNKKYSYIISRDFPACQWEPQGADPPHLPPRRKAGRNHMNEEITPLLPTGLTEQYSKTISNLGHAALLRRCELPLWTIGPN
jgi:hypothetical protein